MASGQQINLGKSSIFYSSNTTEHNRVVINNLLQMSQDDDRCMYLGLQNSMGRSKTTVLGYLKDRVREKLQAWDLNCVSRARKEICSNRWLRLCQVMP